MPETSMHHPSSYRDPSGYIFEAGGEIYRQVNIIFKEDFDQFINSGCYDSLRKKELLISHQNIQRNLTGDTNWYTTLKPERIEFISYSYEWPFDMLKDAALLTLQLLKESVPYGMILKDATPFNIQWHNGKLIFIDTLSFQKYNEEEPWVAYRQFCENFLSPLLLMHYTKKSMHELSLAWPDGIPLSLTKALLPWRSRFSLHTYLHIHLHGTVSQKKNDADNKKIKFSKQKLLNLANSLEGLIRKLKPPGTKTTWDKYYDEAVQRGRYLEKKREILQRWIAEMPGLKNCVDLGANDGEFSRLVAEKATSVVAVDFDANCINRLYNEIKKAGLQKVQPLIMDLAKPSPAIGPNNTERSSFVSRTKADLALALALVHHLAIGKNIPLSKIALFFSEIADNLVIEFVPVEDEKVQQMLTNRKNIFKEYDEHHFEESFSRYFKIRRKEEVAGSKRNLYLMKRLTGTA